MDGWPSFNRPSNTSTSKTRNINDSTASAAIRIVSASLETSTCNAIALPKSVKRLSTRNAISNACRAVVLLVPAPGGQTVRPTLTIDGRHDRIEVEMRELRRSVDE